MPYGKLFWSGICSGAGRSVWESNSSLTAIQLSSLSEHPSDKRSAGPPCDLRSTAAIGSRD